jgi:hypothetical protein
MTATIFSEHPSAARPQPSTAWLVRGGGRWRRGALRSALALLVSAISACALGCHGTQPVQPALDPVPDLDGNVSRAWRAREGIEQRVQLLNARLHTGDTLRIESRLKNVSSDTIVVNRVVCELDIEGDLKLASPLILCFAYSAKGPLAPGEEAVGTLSRIVLSEPGRYHVAIRHLLEPSVWVPAALTVYP